MTTLVTPQQRSQSASARISLLDRGERADLLGAPLGVAVTGQSDARIQPALGHIDRAYPLDIQRLVGCLLHDLPLPHTCSRWDGGPCGEPRATGEIWPACSRRQGTALNKIGSQRQTRSRAQPAPRQNDVADDPHHPIFTPDRRQEATAPTRGTPRSHGTGASPRPRGRTGKTVVQPHRVGDHLGRVEVAPVRRHGGVHERALLGTSNHKIISRVFDGPHPT